MSSLFQGWWFSECIQKHTRDLHQISKDSQQPQWHRIDASLFGRHNLLKFHPISLPYLNGGEPPHAQRAFFLPDHCFNGICLYWMEDSRLWELTSTGPPNISCASNCDSCHPFQSGCCLRSLPCVRCITRVTMLRTCLKCTSSLVESLQRWSATVENFNGHLIVHELTAKKAPQKKMGNPLREISGWIPGCAISKTTDIAPAFVIVSKAFRASSISVIIWWSPILINHAPDNLVCHSGIFAPGVPGDMCARITCPVFWRKERPAVWCLARLKCYKSINCFGTSHTQAGEQRFGAVLPLFPPAPLIPKPLGLSFASRRFWPPCRLRSGQLRI